MPIPVSPSTSDAPSVSGAVGAPPMLPEEFQPVAALLGMVFPGAGQVFLGEISRGVLAAVGVLGLFLGGLLIGGISVVDRKDNPIWFAGEVLVGPVALGVDYLHQSRFKVIDPVTGKRRTANPGEARDPATGRAVTAGPGQGPPYIKSLGRIAELGTLFCTIAGMLNLIVILDAAWHAPRDSALGPGTPGGRR